MAKPTVPRRDIRRRRWDERNMYEFADFNPANLLFQLDLCARVLELLLEFVRLVLAHVGPDLLGGAFHEILGFLEAKTGDRTDFLDHIDLLVSGFHQYDR